MPILHAKKRLFLRWLPYLGQFIFGRFLRPHAISCGDHHKDKLLAQAQIFIDLAKYLRADLLALRA